MEGVRNMIHEQHVASTSGTRALIYVQIVVSISGARVTMENTALGTNIAELRAIATMLQRVSRDMAYDNEHHDLR